MKKLFLISLMALVCLLTVIHSMAQPSQPAPPISGNSDNCTLPVSEACFNATNVVTVFQHGVLRSGSPTSLPAVYSFYNVATVSGQKINATITIDEEMNCDMTGTNFSIDDDVATDQNGNSMKSYFAPRITPCHALTTFDLRGYVQFTIRFFMENNTPGEQYPSDFSTLPPSGGLANLNYIHYDIDGSMVGSTGWFRETGVVKNVPGVVINANGSTELASYTYTHSNSWKGFAGSVYERTGASGCAQVVAAANYSTPQNSVTVRMGYDYNYAGTNFNSKPTRQYASRFGCFSFPQLSTLPVKLLSFNGTLKNNITTLNWAADNQVNFSVYEIQRSENGIDFKSIGVEGKKGEGLERQDYQFTDNLADITANVVYYRLRMIDVDGQFSYSNVIVVRTDTKKTSGISISPNPVVSGSNATVRFESTKKKTIEMRIIDMSGKILLRQQNLVQEGINSVGLINLNQLKTGMYILQVNDGIVVETTKFTIN